jgi:hypothetical protein
MHACAWLLGLGMLARAEISNPATDFMAGQFGLAFHYLKGVTNSQSDWNKTVESFDAKKFAESVSKTGARWCLITLGQNSGYYITPNSVLDRYSGYKPGERNSNRDLPMDIAAALEPYGIRMFFYLPSSVPNGDTKIASAFGLTVREPGGANYMITDKDFPRKWGEVIQEWSTRYKEKLWGWWFDGYYTRVNFTDSMGHWYSDAVKAGNPGAVISLAPGTRGAELWKVRSRYTDFFAGEQRVHNPLMTPKSRWYTGVDSIGPVQWQSIACFGGEWWGWANSKPNQYSDSLYIAYSNEVFAHGGAITWNLYVDATGTVYPTQVEQMARCLPKIKMVSALRRDALRPAKTARGPALLLAPSLLGADRLGLRDVLGQAAPVTGAPWRLYISP